MTQYGKADLWRKAAVLGSLWAASEIVLGSFLHNARVPLTGHLLTGIGIAVLVAGHRLWPQRGLLWRAGLVCAAMKSVSPSAVILAPMLAISMEGFLLEAGVFLAGANPLGYLLAGGLAMSWPLIHTLGNIVLFYGPETAVLYARGWEHLRVWLGRPAESPWSPVLLLGAAHFLGGSLAAVVGLRVGRECLAAPAPAAQAYVRPRPLPTAPAIRERSLSALALHVLFIAAALSLGQRLGAWGLAGASAVYAAIAAARYPRALALTRRFGLWFGILAVSALAGRLLGSWESGAQMGLRAVLLTLGFSCIGEELRNPVLRSWLERRGGRLFFCALEDAFGALPGVFAGLPTGAGLLRSPVTSLRAAVASAPALLDALGQGRVFIITGERGGGKSSAVSLLAESLRRSGLSIGGLHAPGFWAEGRRSGFDVVDLRTGERRPLARREGPADWRAVGAFRFSPDGLAFGLRALEEALRRDVDVLMVDEVGPLELQGQGWAPGLDALARERRKPMVWVVRGALVEEVRRRWGLAQARIWQAEAGGLEAVLAEVRESAGAKPLAAPGPCPSFG